MKRLFVLSATLLSASAAYASPTFQFMTSDPVASGLVENDVAGKLSFLNTTFDAGTGLFTWDAVFSNGAAKDTDGFWLVITPGLSPSGSQFEQAIMYFDGSSLASPKVLIYRYNGSNFEDSYLLVNDLIASSLSPMQTTIHDISASEVAGTREFKFQVDTAAINALVYPGHPEWQGIQFGNQIGIWFHPFADANTTYNGNRFSLDPKGLVYGPTGWYDGSGFNIPAPGAALFVAPLALFAGRRRR